MKSSKHLPEPAAIRSLVVRRADRPAATWSRVVADGAWDDRAPARPPSLPRLRAITQAQLPQTFPASAWVRLQALPGNPASRARLRRPPPLTSASSPNGIPLVEVPGPDATEIDDGSESTFAV